ncbi:hypothetical protein HA402_004641 [Bradysia odoriphaga]|nr:hypothetical protein HA402_004641 [Bradysia odoriphaga]
MLKCGNTDEDIPSMFKECFNLEIDCTNLLPVSICATCYKKLRYSVQFKEMCISSFTFLTEYLEKQSITLIKNENFEDDAYTFASCLNDDTPDKTIEETKHSVQSHIEEEAELPKEKLLKKLHRTYLGPKSRKKNNTNKKPNIDEAELPKEKLLKKLHRTYLGPKSRKKNNTNKTPNIDEEEKETDFTVEDRSSNVESTKNSKTKGKKEKVGKMCQICGQIFKSLQAHLYVHDIFPKFECNICHKKFRHKANVHSHMKIHTNQRDFKCHQCPYKTQFRTSYLRHLQTHTNERNYKCTICEKLFTRKMTLDRHKLTHDLPRVPCPHCDKMFTTKKGLVNHIGIHTGERPFKCKICGMGFVATSSLSVHRRIHKKEDNLLRCKECGLVLANLQMLYNHMKDHNVPSTAEMFLTEVEVVTTSTKKEIGFQDED